MANSLRLTIVVVVVLSALILAAFYLKGNDDVHREKESGPESLLKKQEKKLALQSSFSDLKAMLDFVPEKPGYDCTELFRNTPASAYNMTPMYHRYAEEYGTVSAAKGVFPADEYKGLHYIAGFKFVRNVCETGFHRGCSSFHHLTASDQTIVHSFELGGGLYAKHVAEWLDQRFPNRLNMHMGDSTETVPKFARDNPEFRCDFMYVDGGHVYAVAKADVINFANMANLKRNFIALDDYPPGWDGFGNAWEESVRDGTIRELLRCSYKVFPGSPRGFVVGVVMKRPNGSTS